MRKQTQTRQYGYVSPKCKFVTLTQNLGFCQSEQWGDPGKAGGNLSNGGVYELD